MAYKNIVLSKSGSFELIKSVRSKGSTKYLVKVNPWRVRYLDMAEFGKLADPSKNRRVSAYGYVWKFNTRIEAEELTAMAVLKGLARIQ